MKKILGIFEPGFLPLGGAEKHFLEMLDLLKKKGFSGEIISVSFCSYQNKIIDFLDSLNLEYTILGNKILYIIRDISVTIFLCNNYDDMLLNLKNFINKSKPDIFYSFFIRSVVIDISIIFPEIPVIYFLASKAAEPNGIESNIYKEYITRQKNIYVVSKYLKNYFWETWGIKTHYILDFIDKNKYITERINPEYITMINPRPEKGLNIFLKLAIELPNKTFLMVGGWQILPEEIKEQINNLKNITYIHPTQNMKEIYAKTRILLVPSLWDEPTARVIIEAFYNKIPVIASKKGGMSENLRNTGFSIDVEHISPDSLPSTNDVSKWIESINLLDNKKTYSKISEDCYRVSLQYEKEFFDNFEKYVEYLNLL